MVGAPAWLWACMYVAAVVLVVGCAHALGQWCSGCGQACMVGAPRWLCAHVGSWGGGFSE